MEHETALSFYAREWSSMPFLSSKVYARVLRLMHERANARFGKAAAEAGWTQFCLNKGWQRHPKKTS